MPTDDADRARALCDYFAVDAELAEHPVDGCQWCAAILAAFGEVRAEGVKQGARGSFCVMHKFFAADDEPCEECEAKARAEGRATAVALVSKRADECRKAATEFALGSSDRAYWNQMGVACDALAKEIRRAEAGKP